MHAQELHARQEAELVDLLGDLEVSLEVIFSERVEDTAIHQVGGQSLCEVGQSTVMGPLIRHPVVLHGTYLRVVTSVCVCVYVCVYVWVCVCGVGVCTCVCGGVREYV